MYSFTAESCIQTSEIRNYSCFLSSFVRQGLAALPYNTTLVHFILGVFNTTTIYMIRYQHMQASYTHSRYTDMWPQIHVYITEIETWDFLLKTMETSVRTSQTTNVVVWCPQDSTQDIQTRAEHLFVKGKWHKPDTNPHLLNYLLNATSSVYVTHCRTGCWAYIVTDVKPLMSCR